MHSWDADGFAFLLAEISSRHPAATSCSPRSTGTIAASPNLSDQTRNFARRSPQTRSSCGWSLSGLIKPAPNIVRKYWEDGSWGFARKRTGQPGSTIRPETPALAVMQERAGPLRQPRAAVMAGWAARQSGRAAPFDRRPPQDRPVGRRARPPRERLTAGAHWRPRVLRARHRGLAPRASS